jgi:hypothetical protein
MAFLNPIFLLGVMAAALPVLVHLVRRTRAERLQFPSLMFLRRIEQKTIRQRRLRNLLLLAMRCMALLLLALAFARPYFSGHNTSASGSGKSASVILLDVSYSMRYPGVFERARAAARDRINGASVGEQIALVVFSGSCQVLVPLKADRAEANTLLAQIQPGLGTTDYLQAIQVADAILKDAGYMGGHIYLISDFHQAGLKGVASVPSFSSVAEVIPIDVSEPNPSNLAVTQVRAEPVVYSQKYTGKVIARIDNFTASAERATEAAVELKLNDLVVERRKILVQAGSPQTIEFTDFNVPEGINRAIVEITGDDFPVDNRFFFTIRRENQTKVLAIETATRGRSESFFINQALLAGDNNPYSLTVKTAGSVNPSELDAYRVVIINDATGISEALAAAIKSFVERGGGLIIAAARHTDTSWLTRTLGSILPAKLGEALKGRGEFALLSQVKTDHPILSLFAQSGRLTSTRVYSYRRSEPGEKASVIAALDDGSPLMIEGIAGNGKVILITTSLDTSWNDLPLTPMFLPLINRMLDYLSGHEDAALLSVGQVFSVRADRNGLLPVIDNPSGGRVEAVEKDPVSGLLVRADEVGFYRMRYRDHTEYQAVNLDTRESDFSKMNIDEFIAKLSSGQTLQHTAELDNLSPEQIEARQRLWLPLLALSLLLFIAEAALARRIRISKLIG